jgi:hypothetical protein
MSIMRGTRVRNPHNLHMSRCPVSVELCPRGPGSCMAGSGLDEFLETQANQTGMRHCLFWFMFAAMSTLWTTRNKMVIERVFSRHASDSVFKILASLQLWYPLCRQRDRKRVDGMIWAM